MRQLGVAAVEQRIVQVRVQHAAFQIVQDDPAWAGAKEGERPHVALQPRRGVHMPHDGDKHVPRKRQHQHERVQNHRFVADRVGPLAEAPEIDLRLLAGWGIVAEHGDALATAVGLGEIGQHVATERWQAGLQPLLVVHPLPYGARPIDLQPLDDLVMTCAQLVPGGAVLARLAQIWTHLCHKHRPARGWPAAQCSNPSTTSATRKLLRPTATPLLESCGPNGSRRRGQLAAWWLNYLNIELAEFFEHFSPSLAELFERRQAPFEDTP